MRGIIEDVVVDEAYRGRGIAKALTREALVRSEATGARNARSDLPPIQRGCKPALSKAWIQSETAFTVSRSEKTRRSLGHSDTLRAAHHPV
ncbi:GNAT family N-acetyltransferase [Mesorhizobium sp. M0159]|uniref:GNAT family N-acetyltransferase n=1 Tax=Mesorhizobium sp. M0159 TaxID=2956900 RepID=UPI003334FE6F